MVLGRVPKVLALSKHKQVEMFKVQTAQDQTGRQLFLVCYVFLKQKFNYVFHHESL